MQIGITDTQIKMLFFTAKPVLNIVIFYIQIKIIIFVTAKQKIYKNSKNVFIYIWSNLF